MLPKSTSPLPSAPARSNTKNWATHLWRERPLQLGALDRVLHHFPSVNRVPEDQLGEIGSDIETAETELAIDELGKDKAWGPDGLCAEVVQELRTEFARVYTAVYNACVRTKDAPLNLCS